jgi:hypothetical protein
MGGELLGPDRDCSRDRSPALQAGSAFMELAGLEPATSWVRSLRSLALDSASLGALRGRAAAPPTPSPTLCAAFCTRFQAARIVQGAVAGDPFAAQLRSAVAAHSPAMRQSPRPYVDAMIASRAGVSVRLVTAAFGIPVPSFADELGSAASATKTPTSIETTRWPSTMSRSVAAASGRPSLMSRQLSPPSWDSNKCPQAHGSDVHGRRYSPYTAYTWYGSVESIRSALSQRLGSARPVVTVWSLIPSPGVPTWSFGPGCRLLDAVARRRPTRIDVGRRIDPPGMLSLPRER